MAEDITPIDELFRVVGTDGEYGITAPIFKATLMWLRHMPMTPEIEKAGDLDIVDYVYLGSISKDTADTLNEAVAKIKASNSLTPCNVADIESNLDAMESLGK